MDSNSRNLQYLIQLTKLNLNSLPGLSYEDRDKLFELRREIKRSEVIYKERHFNIYEVDHDSDEDIYDIHDSDEDDDDDDEEDDEMDEYTFEDTVDACRCDGFVMDDMSEAADFPRVLPSQDFPPESMRDTPSCQSGDTDLSRQPVTRATSNYAGSVVNQLLFGRLSHKMQSTPDGGMKVVLRQQCEARLWSDCQDVTAAQTRLLCYEINNSYILKFNKVCLINLRLGGLLGTFMMRASGSVFVFSKCQKTF